MWYRNYHCFYKMFYSSIKNRKVVKPTNSENSYIKISLYIMILTVQRSLVGCSPWGLRVSENQISVILPQSDQVGVSGRSAQVLSKSFSTWARLAFGARRFFAAGMSCALQNGLVSFPGLAPLDTHIIPSPSYANQKCSQTVQSPLGN